MDDMGPADEDLFLNGEDEYERDEVIAALSRPGPVGDLGTDYERTEVAYHTIEVRDNQDGTATVHHVTNDDDDDGYPDGELTVWDTTWPSVALALKNAGNSRIGVSGVRVNVYHNGVRVE